MFRDRFTLPGYAVFLASFLFATGPAVPGAFAQTALDDADKIRRQIEEREKALEKREDTPPTGLDQRVSEPETVPFDGDGVILKSIKVEGSSVYSPEDFGPIFARYLARPLSSDDFQKLSKNITDKYVGDGYFLSQASIPAQSIASGVLTVVVSEGFIGDLTIEGPEKTKGRVATYFRKAMSDRPARLKSLETALMLTNDLHGISIQDVRMAPSGETPDAHDLTLVIQHKRFGASASLDNRGTHEVGPLLSLLSGAVRFGSGLSEFAVTTFFVPDDAEELNYLNLSYNRIIGDHGVRLRTELSGIRVNSGGSLADYDRETQSISGMISATVPVIRRRTRSFWAGVSVDFSNHQRDAFGIVFAEDRLRVLRARLDYYQSDKFRGQSYASVSGHLGVDILGASNDADLTTRSDADGQFVYTRLEFGRDQKITDNIGVIAAFKGQYSKDALPSAEEFFLGGYDFGRGFDSGEASGEHGIGTSLDVYYERALSVPVVQTFRIHTFYDHGFVWNDNFPAVLKRSTIRSYGGGLTLTLDNGVVAAFEVAKPVDRIVLSRGNNDLRYFFSLRSQL